MLHNYNTNKKSKMANKKRLGLVGLLLVGATSILAPNIHAENNVISPTKQYLLGKSEELGLDYEGWSNSLNAKDQEVFTTFANGLIKVIDDLPNDYKPYAQEKFEKLLDTSDVKEVYAEIKQDVLNMPTEEYSAFMKGLTDDVKMLDSFLKDNANSVEKISYSLKENPPEFKQALIDLQNVYLTDLGPLTTNNY